MAMTFYYAVRNYSSWSLRPWLALTWAGLKFEERFVDLDQDGYGESAVKEARAVSPSGKVPALVVDGLTIWDSLSICEWAAEESPAAQLWPRDRRVRAEARSAAAEMHSGFPALRRDLTMNIRRRVAAQNWADDVKRDIARMTELWTTFRASPRGEGHYLFGARSIADAFFTPVATRFRTYSVTLPPLAQAYADTLLADPAFLEWERRAEAEWKPFRTVEFDKMYAGADLPAHTKR
jgi:glutathione S-transferase